MRLIDSDSQMIGIMHIDEALNHASSEGLDLVEISPNAVPPVCKILDFNRYKYDSKKRQQEAKKRQKKVSLKEIKFKINIGESDFYIKLNKIEKFLKSGDKVKISLWFKGREIIYRDKGHKLFDKIISLLGKVSKIDYGPKMEGKQIIMILNSSNVSS